MPWTDSGSNIYFNTGNVGIGNTSPGTFLDIKGDNVFAVGQLRIAATDYSQITFYNSSALTPSVANRLGSIFYDMSGSALVIDNWSGNKFLTLNGNSGGNVGIGTSAPVSKLDLRAANINFLSDVGNLTVRTTDAAANDKGGSIALGGLEGFAYAFVKGARDSSATDTGYLALGTRKSAVGTTEWMRITPTGNVGLGTMTPNPLGISASLYGRIATVANPTAGARALLELWTNAAPTSGQIIGQINFLSGTAPSGARAAGITSSSSGPTANTGDLAFWTSATGGGVVAPRVTISHAGDVGIGTTSPQHKLQVRNDANSNTRIDIKNTDSGTSATAMLSFSTNTGDAEGFIFQGSSSFSSWGGPNSLNIANYANGPIAFTTNVGTERLRITGAGDVGIGTANPKRLLDVAGIAQAQKAYFKNGSPWADVKAWDAIGDGSADDTNPIRDAVTQMSATGGIVFFPPGQYKVTGTITVPANVILVGSGQRATTITSGDVDFKVLQFSGSYSGLEKIQVFGLQGSGAANEVIHIGFGVVGAVFRDCTILGGSWALGTEGVDCLFENCYIAGTGLGGGNIASTGGSWYLRCKIDTTHLNQYGFWQQWNGSTTDVAENHFEQCDFTGEWVAASVRINDYGNNSNITVFSGCVFGAKADTSTPPPQPSYPNYRTN